MPLWGSTDTGNNSPKHTSVIAGSNAIGNTLFANVSPTANFLGTNNIAAGVFGIDITEQQFSNSTVTPSRSTHAGWNIVRQGTGGVLSFGVTTVGSSYANNAAVKVSNGGINAVGLVTTNGTGNITSIAVLAAGQFINASSLVISSNAANSIASVTVSVAGGSYVNGEIVTFGNNAATGVAGQGVIVTNATGNITSVGVLNGGALFPSPANTTVAIANGPGGSGATLTPVLTAGANGLVATVTLGGRAGRIQYECLVAMGMANTANGSGAIPGIGI